jgi:tRNA-specific 2-thiouridylase
VTDAEGAVLGTHEGIGRFTVGQRRWLGVSGRGPLYVTQLLADEGRVVVGPVGDLEVTGVAAPRAVWHASALEGRCQAQVRYRQDPVEASYALTDGRLSVTFLEPVRAAAPGQAVVCYKGDRVLGGGEIGDTW